MTENVNSNRCGSSALNDTWEKSPSQVFWGEIASCDHSVQIYENDKVFLNTLESFAGSGLIAGDSVIIIATPEHLDALKDRLLRQGFNMQFLSAADRYIGLDANRVLRDFMVNGWPDDELFVRTVTEPMGRAKKSRAKVRAFGEMMAVLWQRGLKEATLRLEQLLNHFQLQENFTFFCACPRFMFNGDAEDSIQKVFQSHHKIIDGGPRPSTEVYYKQID